METFAVQLAAAWFIPLQDCDEVFNYWEPLHYLQYGYGSKPWEYSEEYALRSYLYLVLHYIVSLPFLVLPKVYVFKFLKLFLALFSILCQRKLIKALELPNEVSVLFNLTSGMLLSVNTFLPSTFSMNFIMLAFAYFISFYKTSDFLWLFLSLLSCSIAMVIGWPFVALIFASFALPYLLKFPKFLLTPKLYLCGLLALALTIIPSAVVDSYFYNRPVLSFWNLFIYNTSIGKNLVGSSVLFGIDPWYMYIKNLILNLNIVRTIQLFLLFLLSPGYFLYIYVKKIYLKNWRFFVSLWFSSWVWFVLLSSQPHKEERFMYVIYPGILLIASQMILILSKFWRYFIVLAVGLASFSRVFQIYLGYSAPMTIWNGVDEDVCVGGEWHTFPSSYHLNGKLKFYEDGFMGLLPGTFGGNEKMNDRNQKETDRFVPIDQCKYVVAMRFNKDPQTNKLKNWKIVKFEKILDPDTKQPFRSFYFPWNSNLYGTYSLLQNPDYNKTA